MKKKYLFTVILIAFSLYTLNNLMAQKNKLQVGDRIPEFILKDQNGIDVNSHQFIGKKNLVLYFYPKDDTPGCTKEACKFRDEFEVFNDLNAQVIGVSSDSVASHKKFSEKYKLPFILLSDTDKTLRKAFGVPKFSGLIPGRVTYIIDKNGKIIYIFNSMRNAEKHIDEAIRVLKEQE